MVKPEPQIRQSSYYPQSQERRSAECRVIQDAEAPLTSVKREAVRREKGEAIGTSVGCQYLTPSLIQEEVEQNFLKCYAAFLGTDVNDKTIWKSASFNQSSHDRISPG